MLTSHLDPSLSTGALARPISFDQGPQGHLTVWEGTIQILELLPHNLSFRTHDQRWDGVRPLIRCNGPIHLMAPSMPRCSNATHLNYF